MASPSRALERAQGRTRSFGGCATCRNRHVKCDEVRPACAMCLHSGLLCGGYERSIFFDFEGPPEASNVRFRRPLFTERERQLMSEWLVSNVHPRYISHHLSQIDEECEATPSTSVVELQRGPFGAFRLTQTQPQPSSREEVSEQSLDDFLVDCDEAFTPNTQQLFQTFLDVPRHDPPALYMGDDEGHSNLIHEDFNEITIDMSGTSTPLVPSAVRQPLPCPVLEPDLNEDYQPVPSEPSGAPPAIYSVVLKDAITLVKHYSTLILRVLTPFRHSKTPWHVLFVPHIKDCLAALTLGEDMNHASSCAFYATLSISAFSLGGISQSEMWLEQGRTYLRLARDFAHLTLETAYDHPKRAKYKSILIALLSMIHLALVTGDRDKTEHYFIEAEKFIRVKGLNRKKSRKVRMLHHCYVFERMFHESTYPDRLHSIHRRHARKAIEMSGAMAFSQDGLSFRMGDWSNLEEQMQKTKCHEEGENDLHLEKPGLWPQTLYPEIFGVPEDYMFAFSLILRLGEWKDDAVSDLHMKDFFRRAKSVERYIIHLRRPPSRADDYLGQQAYDVGCAIDTMLDAMQNALVIYFYRRIYDMDPSMVRQHVAKVRDCLFSLYTPESGMVWGSTKLLWPAFIAACEAEDAEVQASFSTWFKNAAQESGLRYIDDARESVERIWAKKRDLANANATWTDLLSVALVSITRR